MAKKPLIGFVGQGYVGGNYADDFEKRGYSVVRYSLEPKYAGNKEAIGACDIVFVCVPTPTVPAKAAGDNGRLSVTFDASIVEEGIRQVADGSIAIVKSTLLPGTTKALQKKFPEKTVLCSPEFLSVATARRDAAHPFSNIIGIPKKDAKHKKAAKLVLAVLPRAPFSLVCDSTEAEMIKYAHNANGYFQIILSNLLYDLAMVQKCDWSVIEQAIEHDPFISNRYAHPVHKSGRGAGGACFIKDFAALRAFYEKKMSGDKGGSVVLKALEAKNIALLLGTHKDLDLLEGVYGSSVVKGRRVSQKKR